jgi:hypothetical protein
MRIGEKMGFRRTKLSVKHVNNVTSFYWAHNFIDLTLNIALGWDQESRWRTNR